VDSQLNEANSELTAVSNSLSSIYDELNWWGENNFSLAKQVLGALDSIESAATS
jgi:hypothetical protein